MNTRSIRHTLSFIGLYLFVIVGIVGCASQLTVQVSSIADTEIKPATTRYVLLNGNAEGQENDLFFREFSAYFIPILAQKGYQQVATRDKADIEIFFRYGVSDGRAGIHTFTHPLYETFGGNTITFTETKTDSSGTTTTTQGTVHVPLQTQYVGTAVESSSYVEYTCSAALEAYKISTDEAKEEQPAVLWKTLMSSTSDSNDLRSVIPIMAAAAEPYLAGNSGAAKSIRMKLDDPRVLQIKKQVAQ
jgi:hypothetical protein